MVASLPPLVTVGMVGAALPQLDNFRVRQIDVPIAGLPEALEGMTIAHVSDVHVGKYTKGPVLEAIVATTNSLKPDLILMTGDLIDWSMKDLPSAIQMMKAFRTATGGGAIMCEGNHDLFDDRLGFEQGVKNAGISLLLNESQIVPIRGQKVQLLGIKWGGLSANRRDASINSHVNEVVDLRQDDAFPILLAHHPHAFDAAAARGIPLTLAGHTHGGQLMIRELGAGPMLFKYWSGLYRDLDASLVVSNGVGNWFPLRVGAPAEILHLKLRKAVA
jgi:predicted MPP superfamily phosphohydrolase